MTKEFPMTNAEFSLITRASGGESRGLPSRRQLGFHRLATLRWERIGHWGYWSFIGHCGIGHWSLVIGHWSLVIGHWSLVIGHWSLVIGHWSLVIGHWSLVIGHWSLVIGHWVVQESPLPSSFILHPSSFRASFRNSNAKRSQSTNLPLVGSNCRRVA